MNPISRILAPIEFSPRCRGAVHYAEALACHFHSQIVLLHVVSPPAPMYGSEVMAYSSLDLTGDQEAKAKELLARFCDGELDQFDVRRVLFEDDPATGIVHYAEAEGCNLIVMPTHGYGPFRRFLLGSVTAKVLHDSTVPVWTGPHMEQAPAVDSISFGKIMAAVDLGPDTCPVLEWASGFARDFGAELGIVHCIPLTTVRLGPVFFDPEWRHHIAHTAEERIHYYLDEHKIKAEVSIEIGEPPAAIRDATINWNANVLVIGRGRSGRRTHAYGILRESPCPVAAI